MKIVQQEPQRRSQLWQNVNYLKQLIQDSLPNLKLLPTESAILCFQLPNAAAALTAGKLMQASGVFAPAIRPPTVTTSRIRISMMATHELAHIQKLVEVIKTIEYF
jgi:8-amino-7-oxononanoate synthase